MRKIIQRIFSQRVMASLTFGIGLLTPLSLILAVQFLRSGNTVLRWVERPVVIDRMAPFLKEPVLRKNLWACLHRKISGVTKDPFPVGVEIAVGHYLHGKEGLRHKIRTEGTLTQPPQRTPRINPLTEREDQLDYAYMITGYAETPAWNPRLQGANQLLQASPMYLWRWIQDVVGEELIPISTQTSATFFPGDHIYDCIQRLETNELKVGALYSLSDGRKFVNPIVIENHGDTPATDVFMYISRPWQGRFSVIEKSVRAAGGEILYSGSFYHVIKFPVIAGHSHKAIVVTTSGAELRDEHVRIEFVQQRSLNDWWIISGLIGIILLGFMHFWFSKD